ncbi:MAG: hypothetical protein JWP01_1833 [Myxococcales bacterium]|nr:hypothetical protein [Myxococcales bacterium]
MPQLEGAQAPELSSGSEAIQWSAPEHDGTCAERERLDDIGAATKPAIDHHLEPVAHSSDDLGQDLDRCKLAVELAAAVVADDDRVDTELRRLLRVVGPHHALEHQLPLPALAEHLDRIPRQRGIAL